ncbi:MAG: hypothetical protein ACUZ8E_08825, partial [Candidatus Anammoxibacter sp.]
MSITQNDYYRKGNVFLESSKGRKDIFELFSHEISTGLKENNESVSMSSIRELSSYLIGDNLIFLNKNLPNAYTLCKKKDDIKIDALECLRDNVDLIKKVYLNTDNVNHKFDIIYIFLKFFHKIEDLRMKHYTDLYLMMFHTLLRLDDFQGDGKDKDSLGEIIAKGCGRFDCVEMCGFFTRDSKLIQFIADNVTNKIAPYKKYVARLKDETKKMKISGAFDEEIFTPLLYTNTIFHLLDETYNSYIKDSCAKNRDKILSFISSRCYELFKDERMVVEILNKTETLIDEKISDISSDKH